MRDLPDSPPSLWLAEYGGYEPQSGGSRTRSTSASSRACDLCDGLHRKWGSGVGSLS